MLFSQKILKEKIAIFKITTSLVKLVFFLEEARSLHMMLIFFTCFDITIYLFTKQAMNRALLDRVL